MISVVERRRCPLTIDQQRLIDGLDGFWRLGDAGYLSYRRTGSDRFELVGHKYVGRARIGDVEVQVREKVPGTLLALVGAATGAELRIEAAGSPATEFDLVSRHLMAEFTKAAGRYIADRRKPRYYYRDAAGPVLAGALSLPATMRLHATGRLGLFAYRQGVVIRDEPLDRLVLAGLDELDRAAGALQLDTRTIYDARWLAGALDEVRDQAFLASSRDDFLALADNVENDTSASPVDVDLARLAAVALLHRGFEPELPGHGEVPRAWFVDLETLFEQAVRETLRELLTGTNVDRGEVYERRIFFGGSDSSRTNPDLVLHRDGVAVAVGDVKYKSLAVALGHGAEDGEAPVKSKKEGRPDLYQVLAHAASLKADRAFLVYAGDDAYASRYLGRAATGCRTWTAQVRPTRLAEDLARFVEENELL